MGENRMVWGAEVVAERYTFQTGGHDTVLRHFCLSAGGIVASFTSIKVITLLWPSKHGVFLVWAIALPYAATKLRMSYANLCVYIHRTNLCVNTLQRVMSQPKNQKEARKIHGGKVPPRLVPRAPPGSPAFWSPCWRYAYVMISSRRKLGSRRMRSSNE